MSRAGANAGVRYVGPKKQKQAPIVPPVASPSASPSPSPSLEARGNINIQQIETIVETEVGFKKPSRKKKYGK